MHAQQTLLRSRRWLPALLLLAVLFAGIGYAATATEGGGDKKEAAPPPAYKRLPDLPFMPGEKIYYELRWGVFEVGTATMEFIGPVQREGVEVWQIELKAQTNSFADKIFKVRDYNAVWVDKEFTKPVYYVKNQNEGSTHREVVVTFDWDKNKAQYSDKGVARDAIDIQPGSWDPLGITYAVRALDLDGVEHLSISSTDGKKSATAEIVVSKPVIIRIPAGRFETLVLKPDTKDLGGVFRKSKNAGITIWFTNDARHLPVRMSSSVAVGSFVAEMVRIEGPGADAYNRKDKDKGAKPRGGSKASASAEPTGQEATPHERKMH